MAEIKYKYKADVSKHPIIQYIKYRINKKSKRIKNKAQKRCKKGKQLKLLISQANITRLLGIPFNFGDITRVHYA